MIATRTVLSSLSFTAKYSIAQQKICKSSLSSLSAVEKLKDAVEEYRRVNYAQCLPSRFRKELFQALDKNSSGAVNVQEFNRFLERIGAMNRVSNHEIDSILNETGSISGTIPLQTLEKIIIK